jgi:vitamin B12 transporter
MRYLAAALAPALLLPAIAPAQSVFDLDEIVFSVNASETELNRIGNSVTVITEDDFEQAGDTQLTEILARLPGVSLWQTGPQGSVADIRIRGAQGRYISVYIDGILVTDPASPTISYDDFGGLTAASIRRIEVLRGSQSALYGGTAVGGVINISTIAGPDSPEGTSQTATIEAGSYNTVALSYGLTQRSGPLILTFGVNHIRSDGFSASDENAGNTETDGFNRSRLSFGLKHEVNETLAFGLHGFVESGQSDADEFHNSPVDGSVGDDFGTRDAYGLRAYAEWRLGAWDHDAALSLYRIDRRNASLTLGAGAPNYLSPFDNTFSGRRLAFDYSAAGSISSTVQLALGANVMQETGVAASVPGGRSTVDTIGTFAEAIWSPLDQFDFTTTIRHDEHSRFGGQSSGRLAFAWRPNSTLVLRGAVGTGYRPPSIDELFGAYPESGFLGNPNLVAEESLSAEIGSDYAFAGGGRISATLFQLDVDNLITYCSAYFLADPGCPPMVAPASATLFNVAGKSRRRGLEITGQFPITDALILDGAYTYTDAKSGTGAPLTLVPEHDIVLGIDARWAKGWDGGLTLRRVIGTLEGASPLPDYTLVNASVGYEVSDGVEAYLRVHNLLATEYQTRRGYGTSDRAIYVGLRSRF